jgi:glyoxylase-like metal-dependent hydrolase (beta-lactamase superfamily II)
MEDNKQALASLDRLAELPADTLLPGHGDPWHDSSSHAVRIWRAGERAHMPPTALGGRIVCF